MLKNLKAKTGLLLALACLLMFALPGYAGNPLPPDKAFQFSLQVESAKQLKATWQMTPGYYLYRDRIHIESDIATLNYQLPDTDKQFKGKAVYQKSLQLPVELNTKRQVANIKFIYQGCAQDGFCYPYITKHLKVNLQNGKVSAYEPFSIKKLLTNQYDVQELFASSSLMVTLGIFFALGLLLALTPCVLPMVPILTGIIVGYHGHVSTKKAFILALVYVIGMAITYAAAGIVAVMFGNSIQVWLQQPAFLAFGAAVLALLAFSLLGAYQLRFSHHWQNLMTNWSNYHQGGSYVGVFCMGVLSTLIVSPCITAPMIGVLMYVAQSGNIWIGGSSLFLMGLGMGVPLLLVGMSAGHWLPKTGAWMEAIKKLFGVLMLVMAVWLVSRVLSPAWLLLLWSMIGLITAYLLAFSLPRLLGRPLLYRGMSLLVLGAAFYFVLIGFNNSYYSAQTTTLAQKDSHGFTVVTSLSDLERKLQLAGQENRPVMLDFYADWCESCVSMDKHVLGKQKVKQLMKSFELLRVDLSNNTSEDAEIMRHYQVIAPPTVLFFNVKGQEVQTHRIVGEMSEQEFASKLNLFFVQGCDSQQYC